MGFFDRLKSGLTRTTQQIAGRFDELVGQADTPERRSRPIDVETVDALEELLISADVGVAATDRIVAAVGSRARRGESLRELVQAEIRAIFADADERCRSGTPHVVLVVGVNGTGKTTTVGKLANLAKTQGQQPLICAADTFRAAAVDQLQIWADRAGVEMMRPAGRRRSGGRRFRRGRRRQARGVAARYLVDTAGRLHTRANLMQELDKIRRVAARAVPGAPHEVLIVLDATVGQNGLTQAREFTAVAGVNGVVLTKLDGTAKGGVAVAIAHDLKLPIRYVGVGEGIGDLMPFSPDEYVTRCSRRSGRRGADAARAAAGGARARAHESQSDGRRDHRRCRRDHRGRRLAPAGRHATRRDPCAGRRGRPGARRDAAVHARAVLPPRPDRAVHRRDCRGRHLTSSGRGRGPEPAGGRTGAGADCGRTASRSSATWKARPRPA